MEVAKGGVMTILTEDRVKKILEKYPEARESDKLLMYYFYRDEEGVDVSSILKTKTSMETITRCRRKIQESGDLVATLETRKKRKELEKTFINYSR